MRFLIVDGDIDRRLRIRAIAQSFPQISEILESDSAEDALFRIFESQPSIMVISTILPGRKGFDLAYLLNKLHHPIKIIVISDSKDDAIDAIRAYVTDFFVDPFLKRAFTASVKKIVRELEQEQRPVVIPDDSLYKVKISTSRGFQLVNLMDIVCCEADGAYTKIVFRDGEYLLSSLNLAKVEKLLEGYHFAKINRSCIVNLRFVKEVDIRNQMCVVEMIDSTKELKISSPNLNNFEKKYLSK